MARVLAVLTAWALFSLGTGYVLAGLGAGSFGVLWVAGSSVFCGAVFSPLLALVLPDD